MFRSGRAIMMVAMLLFHNLAASAQKMPGDYFNEGVKALENKQYASALQSFQYIARHHPRNRLYPRAVYNIGYTYQTQKSWDSAIAVYKRILVSGFNEKEDRGGSIMDDPYTNYCHHAAANLYTIYLEHKKQYYSALVYLYMSDTLFPYLHFCGNELAGNSIWKALQYAKVFTALHKPDSAIKSLLPVVFISNIADNSGALEELRKLLTSRGDKALKSSLDDALSKIYSRQIIREADTSVYYYFRFLDYEFRAPYYEYEGKSNKREAADAVKETAFYKMIGELDKQ